MAFVITQPCIDTRDQACVEVCPVDCIHFEESSDRMLYINPAECIDCGACQPACPVQAIFPEGDVPGEMSQFIDLNSRWYGDAAGVRAAVASMAAGPGSTRTEAAGDAPAAAPTAAKAATPEPAAAAKAAPKHEDLGAYKYGEGGIEGKCALCGQYVTKGGVKFRQKSVLCPECAERESRIGDPYGRLAGRR
jgi:ferredoxin